MAIQKPLMSRNILLFYPAPLTLAGLLISSYSYGELYFDPNDLKALGGVSNIDLSAFNNGGFPAGSYNIDIYVNNIYFNSQTVDFRASDGTSLPEPQLTLQDWESFGARAPALRNASLKEKAEVPRDPGKYIPGATARFNYSNQQLYISIPQAYLNTRAQASVDPSRWDDGINALLLNYSVNASRGDQHDNDSQSDSLYMNLMPGINLGAWRVRNNTTYTRNVQESNAGDNGRYRYVSDNWQNLATYAQRDIASLRSRLTLGESSTPGDVMSSFAYNGVQLASDDSMLPDSLRGYAPVVRGVAVSNAQVSVSQKGAVIYQTYVPPGPFELRDISPSANGGELFVTIREADGSVKSFTQPSSAIPGMQREGRLRYSLTAGRFRSFYSGAEKPAFSQGIAQYGLSNDITLYGGSILANKYQSLLGGIGKGLGDFGSLSLDVTRAATQLPNDSRKSGEAYRIQYAKYVMASGTLISAAGYRYNSSGYYDFDQRNQMISQDDDSWQWRYSKKSSMQFSINQSLNDWGNLSASYWMRDYWDNQGTEKTASLNYSQTWNSTVWNLAFNVSRTPNERTDNQIALSLQVPLDSWLSGARARYSLNHSDYMGTTNLVSLSGNLPAQQNISYSVQQSVNSDSRAGGSVFASWRHSAGQLSGGYSYSGENRTANIGLNGSLIAHSGGVTAGQQFYDTAVLIHAEGAEDVNVNNNNGVYTNRWGYAVLPDTSIYRNNRINISQDVKDNKLEIKRSTVNVVPTKGAVVLANFNTEYGDKALVSITHSGQEIPVGAEVYKVSTKTDSITIPDYIGPGSAVYLTGLHDNQKLNVKWADGGTPYSCSATLKLSDIKKTTSEIARSSVECK